MLVIIVSVWSISSAQDLVTVWGNYITIDEELTQVKTREQFLKEQQDILHGEIRTLQERKSWYNGWINKMKRVRKSEAHSTISDSLLTIRRELVILSGKRDDAFLALRRVYEYLLLESEISEELSIPDKETVISLGQWILIQRSRPLDFPDYSSILASNFEDEEIKQLVLVDLQSVLETKLFFIDSLLTERYSETELVNRLNEFHRDLSLQMESDRDLGTMESQEFSTIKTYLTNDEGVFGVGDSPGRIVKEDVQSYDITALQTQVPSEKGMISLSGFDLIEGDIALLELKRQQYQQLLHQIKKELVH